MRRRHCGWRHAQHRAAEGHFRPGSTKTRGKADERVAMMRLRMRGEVGSGSLGGELNVMLARRDRCYRLSGGSLSFMIQVGPRQVGLAAHRSGGALKLVSGSTGHCRALQGRCRAWSRKGGGASPGQSGDFGALLGGLQRLWGQVVGGAKGRYSWADRYSTERRTGSFRASTRFRSSAGPTSEASAALLWDLILKGGIVSMA